MGLMAIVMARKTQHAACYSERSNQRSVMASLDIDREELLGDHPKPAIEDHFKTGQR